MNNDWLDAQAFQAVTRFFDSFAPHETHIKKAGKDKLLPAFFAPSSDGAIGCESRLRTNDDVVTYASNVLHAAGDIFSLHFFCTGFCKSRQLHRAIERFNADGRG